MLAVKQVSENFHCLLAPVTLSGKGESESRCETAYKPLGPTSAVAVLPFSYALAQLHPLLNRVPSRSTSSPFELPLLLLEADEDTFLTAPRADLWDVAVAEVTVPGAETLLPPFDDREETVDGDGNGLGTTEVLTGFKLRERFLPHPFPHLSEGSLIGNSSCVNGRGEGGGVSFPSDN